MAHTPGPWETGDSRWPHCIVAPRALPGALSLSRVLEYRYAREEDLALIAAAPDLLAALRGMRILTGYLLEELGAEDGLGDGDLSPQAQRAYNAYMPAAGAALAKAEGR